MSVDELVESMDLRFKAWTVYRNADNNWIVAIRDDGETFTGKTLSNALDMASKHRVIPIIPRCPSRLFLSMFEAVKDSHRKGHWTLLYDRKPFHVSTKTKADAMKSAEGFASRSEKEIDEWQAEYGTISMGVPGKDFGYK